MPVEKRTIDSYGEIQREIFHIPLVVLQEDEAIVKIQVQGLEVVKERLFSQPLQPSSVVQSVTNMAGKKMRCDE